MLPPRHTLELVTDKAGGCTSGLTGLPTFHTRGVKGAVRGVVCVCVCVCVCEVCVVNDPSQGLTQEVC